MHKLQPNFYKMFTARHSTGHAIGATLNIDRKITLRNIAQSTDMERVAFRDHAENSRNYPLAGIPRALFARREH
jgi:hypothetical protein